MSIAEIIEDEGGAQPLSIRVRLASLRDYEELCALFDQLDELHRQARPDMFQPFPPPARTREQVAALAGQSDLDGAGGAERGGRGRARRAADACAVGLRGRLPRKVVEVDNLVVRADQRGRRIGRRLLAAAVEWSRQRRATHVEVAVHDFNRDARRFYESFGFAASVDRLVLAA